MRVTQRMLVDTVRLNISRNAQSLNTLQDQLSSGKRLRRASDDPASLNRALALKAASSQNAQYLRNITTARGWLETTDSALEHLSSVLTRARDIALRAASDTLGVDERQKLAGQIEALMHEAQQVGNTKYEGKYIFAGRQVGTVPFDVTQNPIYQGDSGAVNREIDSGVTIQVNTLNSEVSISVTDAGGTTSFKGVIEASLTVLNAMKARLSGGQGLDATQVEQLTECTHGVLELRGAVGARMSRLDATEKVLNDSQASNAVSLSRAQDADVAEVITKLMMQENVYKAALAAGARVVQPSLMDFLR